MSDYTRDEMMTVAAARLLRDGQVCFVGIGLPSAACNLARLTHAPNLVLIYESGTIGTRPDVLPLSIGDPELCTTARCTVSVPEMFQYWLQGGRISVGFLGGAQLDRYANINSSVVGSYASPKVRAWETASLACAALNVDPVREDSLSNGFSRVDALALLEAHDGNVLVVGHEPSFSQVVYDFTGARIDFKKGGVAAVHAKRSAGELLALLRPKELEAIAASLAPRE